MKNILLGSVFLLASTGVFAQLTIKPNGSVDSYMYVKDQIVYVDGGIKLDKNPGTTYEASIYLRDNGQLIQGDHVNSTNSGNGYLSVQQKTKPTNAYAYYHWASPVGNSEALGDGTTGNINFGIRSIYEALGGPDGLSLELGTKAQKPQTTTERNGFTNPEFTISTRWLYTRLEPKTEAEDAYQRINWYNNVPAGFGFTMKGVHLGTKPEVDREGPFSDHEQLYEFRGRPNSGTFTIPVDGPDPSDPPNNPDVQQRMTLAGNPYPSALDLNWVFHELGNEDLVAFYYYDADRTVMSHFYSDKPYGFAVWIPSAPFNDKYPGESGYETGDYADAAFYIWNKWGTATGGQGTSTAPAATRIAPIGQGIMFAGNTENRTLVKVKNEHRRFVKQGDYSVFHRPEPNNGGFLATHGEGSGNTASREEDELASQADNRTSKLRLYVVFDDALTRDLLLTFSNEATDGFDRGYDAPSPMPMNSDAFFPILRNDRLMPFVINGTNYNGEKRIPLAFVLDKQRKISILVAEEVRRPYREVFLYDNVNNTHKVLTPEEVMGTSFILPAGEYLDRFFIVFNRSDAITPWRPSDVETFKAQVNVFQNNPGQQLEIQNPHHYDIKSMNMFDMTGKLIISQKNLGKNDHHSFPTGNLSDGVYIIKMTTASEMQIDYKVVIMNK